MCKNKQHLIWLMGFIVFGDVSADRSPRIYSVETGSYYQIFYWGNSNNEESEIFAARTSCKSKGGHLVTITSKTENNFLNEQMIQYDSRFWIGASDEKIEKQWQWITNEPWGYSAWQPGEPGNDDYAYFAASTIAGGGRWYGYPHIADSKEAYVCEWESDYTVTNTLLGDYTGDRVADIGVYKYSKGIRTVNIINAKTGQVATKLTFGAVKSLENSFITPVSDMNNNKKSEVALVYKKAGIGPNIVIVKDSATNLQLKTFNVPTGSADILGMSSVPDLNGNGVSELQFLLKSTTTGQGQLLIVDPKTGVKLSTYTP